MDEKPRGKLLLVILCVVFLDLVGIGILIPVVPILLAPPAFRDRFSFQGGFAFYTTFIGVYFINKFNFTS